MTINAPLLRQTLAHIEAHPETWEQAVYRCSTGMCFAGWACALAGGKWVSDATDPAAEYLVPEPADHEGDISTFLRVDGTRGVRAERRAARLLGLTDEQADDLFSAGNNILDLREYVSELCGEATP
jgi:hypothetical protein